MQGEEAVAKSLLSTLLVESRLYHSSEEYLSLLKFTARMPKFAPFNAMLLNVQRPGLRYAASYYEWVHRFKRTPKDGARPLLILWPFGPVAFVYDVADTDGAALPEAVLNPFQAAGTMTRERVKGFIPVLKKRGIEARLIEYGPGLAGSIHGTTCEGPEPGGEAKEKGAKFRYVVRLNQQHDGNVQFATLTHELAHLFLGHLGADSFLKTPDRWKVHHEQKEFEAESLSFLVCARNGVQSHAESYLSQYVEAYTTIEDIDLYLLMKAAGQVEAALSLGETVRFEPKEKSEAQASLF